MVVPVVTVIGSINYDLIVQQDRLPHRGETIAATGLRGDFGGKGANQAVQAARLGAHVLFIGSAGDDDYGSRSRENLRGQGIDCRLNESPSATGLGIVHVVDGGEVYATIVEGANADVTAEWVDRNADAIDRARVVILQNEVPNEANERAALIARRSQIPVILNAAPARPLSPGLLHACTWMVVNEDEATTYLGHALGDPHDDAAMRAALALLTRLCPNIVLTLGGHGCYVAQGARAHFIPAVTVEAVDTTGAGDSFIGAFAVSIAEGMDPFRSAEIATVIASQTVRGLGAQASMPRRIVKD